MDSAWSDRLREGAAALRLDLPEAALAPLLRHVELLLKWNKTINLTAITDPDQVLELHVLDSLAAAAKVPPGTLLDAGTGAGFPGVPIRLLRADVAVTLVDSVGKKVAFLKNLLADLRLPGTRAVAARLAGKPHEEGLGLFDGAISRAFTAPEAWVQLATSYVKPGGTILCLAGPRDPMPAQVGAARRVEEVEFALPFSGAARRIGRYLVAAE